MPSFSRSRHPLERLERRLRRTSRSDSAGRPFTAGNNVTPTPAACLADARTGDVVAVEDILFDSVRSHCRELGILKGDLLVCRRRDRHGILLEHEHCGSIYLDSDRARFISIQKMMAVA